MDPDSVRQPTWVRVLRFLNASFRLGRFFGVEVRVYWLVLLVMPLICLPRASGSAVEALVMTAIVVLGLYTVVYTHEMSHIVAGWRYRVRTQLITLSPLGGVAHMSSNAPDPRAEMVISAAGPLVHLPWLAVFWPLSLLLDYGAGRPAGWALDPLWFTVDLLVYTNLALMLFNLLPFFPMDGGRILRAWLATRMHPNRASLIAARVGMAGSAVLVVAAFFLAELWTMILIVIAITNFLTCRQEIRAARYHEGPYGAGEERLEPWQTDPDAWKRGGAADAPWEDERPRREGFMERRRRQRREREAARRRRERRELDAQLDLVLERISEVGMENLTARERRILDRAAKLRRGTGVK